MGRAISEHETTPCVLLERTAESSDDDTKPLSQVMLMLEIEEEPEEEEEYGDDDFHRSPPDCCNSSCSSSTSFLSAEDMILHQGHRKTVAFDRVEVREYSITIGDHPCCPTGCALTLDWHYTKLPSVSIDTYEHGRAPLRKQTRRNDLRLSWEERKTMLSKDHSDGEIRKNARKLHRARTCRTRLSERMSESFFGSEKHNNNCPTATVTTTSCSRPQ